MTTTGALLEACRLARDDDAPRLVWADHIGGERGELVVVQCELARDRRSPAEMAALRRRERELLAAHGDAWSGLRGYAASYELRRGFVEAAEIDVATFVEHDAAIAEAAPLLASLTAIGLTDDAIGRMRRLLETPGFWRLEALEIVGAGFTEPSADSSSGRRFTGLGDEIAQLLPAAGALAQLRALGFTHCDLSARGIHWLVASRDLGGLERLRLRETHDVGVDATVALLRATPNLRSLAFGVTDLDEIAPMLGPLTELEVGILADDNFAALSRSPAAATIESLLVVGDIPAVEAFAQWPRLRALDLRGATLDLVALAATAIPTLRRLRCSPRISPPELRALARGFGGQLEVLDARGALGIALDELAPLVAGEVLLARPHRGPRLL